MYFSSTILTSITVITKHLNLYCLLESQLYGQITFILFFIQWTVSVFHVRQHCICSALWCTARRPVHLSMQNVNVLVVLLYFWFPPPLCKKEVVDGRRSQLLSNKKLCNVSATKFLLLFPKSEANAILCGLSRLSWSRISFTAPSWRAAWRLCCSLTAPLAPSPGSLKFLTSGHSISIR